MSAGASLQAAVVPALQDLSGLTGIFDGPPARASYPYAVVDAGTELDWGHKSGAGREVVLALTLWDDQPERLQQLADRAETAVENVLVRDGWKLVSLNFMRRRVIRDVAGPWAAALDFRARLLKSA